VITARLCLGGTVPPRSETKGGTLLRRRSAAGVYGLVDGGGVVVVDLSIDEVEQHLL
jgi:hypothetical protein